MRKIIHIDMDCFYAAIEMRDNPELKHKPVAVGGVAAERGVLCTCNYEARQFGVHSAMSTAIALKLCPQLQLLPVNMAKYREVSNSIREVFFQYTDWVEPLSLDEAFLDVTEYAAAIGSATWVAEEIQNKIFAKEYLTASAGIAPNKFLAKIASDWRKPNGCFTIAPEQVDAFVAALPVTKIFGVGKVMAKKLHQLNIETCADLQKIPLIDLVGRFGKMGARLYQLAQGVDDRPVNPNRIRKSLSVEHTYAADLQSIEDCLQKVPELFSSLQARLSAKSHHPIHKNFVKIKFHDFTHTTVECVNSHVHKDIFMQLLQEGYLRAQKPVRLLGLGVRFAEHDNITPDLFEQQ